MPLQRHSRVFRTRQIPERKLSNKYPFISYIDVGRMGGPASKREHYGVIVARAAAALATICGGSGI